MDKRRGGWCPEHRLHLALLGETPRLMATAGQDFGDYRRWLEAAGVDTTLVADVHDKFTASFFCSTDVEGNQIASFYTGAMANAAELSFRTVDDCEVAIISPNDPAAMIQYAEECRDAGDPLHLGSRPAVRAHGRRRAPAGGHRRRAGGVQRLRAGTAAAEKRVWGRPRFSRTPGASSWTKGSWGALFSRTVPRSTFPRCRPRGSSIRPGLATPSAGGS
jgi:hypothetical protein